MDRKTHVPRGHEAITTSPTARAIEVDSIPTEAQVGKRGG